LSLTLRTMQVGTAYAIWAGVGTVLISIVAWLFYNQKLDAPSILGISLIISGVVIIKFLSPQG
jgi:small multidrug resistance pump